MVRGPGVHAEAALPAPMSNERAVHDLEVQPKAPSHLTLPLQTDRSRTADQNEVGLLAQNEFLHHESRLDGLSEADVVRDARGSSSAFISGVS